MVAALSLSRGIPPAVRVSLPIPPPDYILLFRALPRLELHLRILRERRVGPRSTLITISDWTGDEIANLRADHSNFDEALVPPARIAVPDDPLPGRKTGT
jgi:hypothetical protein